MLRYFIQVIESFSVTALLIALLFSSIASGLEERKKWFARSCAISCAASLVLSVLKRTTPFINRTIINAWTFFFAVPAGIIVLVFLFAGIKKSAGTTAKKSPPGTAPGIWGRVSGALPVLDAVSLPLLAALLLFYALPTVFLYPSEFLLAGETAFSTDFLFKCIGYVLGIIAVALGALAVGRAGIDAPPPLLRAVLAPALVVNILSQLSVLVQFLFARRIIRIIPWLFSAMAAALNHAVVFFYAVIALILILPLAVFIKSFAKPVSTANPAEGRKRRAFSRRLRRWALSALVFLGAAAVSLAVLKPLTQRGVTLSPAEPMTIAGNEIIIPLEQVDDGHLHRFAYTAAEETEVRFIVIKKNEAAFGVGLDACDICGATGYYERKNEVICRLCDVVMNKSTIGFRGGCNPVPLAYALKSGSMIVQTSDLENERWRFK
ncbi:MAG: Fe-S-containing protein [Spirochaetaceae bacterium]|jgi:uncharacterized membrane protein|nr:Fe-S-containing protein [Spirochaetaceae bacterium]